MKRKKRAFQVKSIVIGEGLPKICMPLVGKTEEELLAGVQEAKALGPDVIEWRADFFKQVGDAEALLAMADRLRGELPEMPLLFTLRDVSEGGFTKLSQEVRADLIRQVIASGKIDLVDIELEAVKNGLDFLVSFAKEQGVGVILSNHFFTRTPSLEEIVDILREEQSCGADIAKLAVMPNSPEDVLTLLCATNQMETQYAEIPLITMSMGQLGICSRICGGVFGSTLTFGAGQNTSAPGQIGVKELRKSLLQVHGEMGA
jgi:3-dehydroquinate dehydratase-1